MRSLEFDQSAFEDLAYWVENDKKIVLKIFRLINEVQRNPFHGIGKPEPLRRNLAGLWSRRIDNEHRLIYDVRQDKIIVLACRYHYD